MSKEEESILDELRRYAQRSSSTPTEESSLSETSLKSSKPEQAEIASLKRELNLAARVGQSLLTQLQQMESTLDSERRLKDSELDVIRLENSRLQAENLELGREHETALQTLEDQDVELKALIERLSEANVRADRLARAAAHARSLEDHVHLLEQMHEALQKELLSTKAQLLGASLREELSRLNSQLDEPIPEVHPDSPAEVSHQTPRRKPHGLRKTTSYEESPLKSTPQTQGLASLKPSAYQPSPLARRVERPALITPDQSLANDTDPDQTEGTWVDDSWLQAPPLTRSRSHESVLSLVFSPEAATPFSARRSPYLGDPGLRKFDSPLAKHTSRAETTTVHVSPSVVSRGPVPARDRLLSMKSRVIPDSETPVKSQKAAQSRWLYVPFKR